MFRSWMEETERQRDRLRVRGKERETKREGGREREIIQSLVLKRRQKTMKFGERDMERDGMQRKAVEKTETKRNRQTYYGGSTGKALVDGGGT
jgi:hypothetical protein